MILFQFGWTFFLNSLWFSVTVVKSLKLKYWLCLLLKKWLLFCDFVYFFLLYSFTFFWFSLTGIINCSSVVVWIFSLPFFVCSFEVLLFMFLCLFYYVNVCVVAFCYFQCMRTAFNDLIFTSCVIENFP